MLTAAPIPPTPQSVGRPKINHEQTPARFASGTLARIDAELAEGEARSDFIRTAVEAELDRRAKPLSKMTGKPKLGPADWKLDTERAIKSLQLGPEPIKPGALLKSPKTKGAK